MGSILLFSILAILAMMLLLMILVVDQVRGMHRAIVPEEYDLEDEHNHPNLQHGNAGGATALAFSDADGHEGPPLPQEDSDKPDTSFGTMVSKRLWDAMTGKPLPDLDEKLVEELKPRYHVLLAKHGEELFQEGVENGKAGKASVPQNKRKVKGLRGSVISWIPQQHADAIYQAGFDSVAAQSPETRQPLQKSLMDALNVIATRTGMRGAEALAEKLLPLDPTAVQAPEADGSASGEADQSSGPPALPAPGSATAEPEPAPPAVGLNSPEMTAAVAAAAKAAMKQDGVPA
jgi:hypothetical protein